MINKKGFEFSFAWLFAIIVGAAIIFFAIYATTNLISTERRVGDSESAKQIGILLSPIETSLEDVKTAEITFPTETRLLNDCYEKGNFGRQNIQVSSKLGVGKEFDFPGEPSTFYNKYIFSEEIVQAKRMKVFARPFSFPFKVADLTFIFNADRTICFINPPGEIEEEMTDLNLENIKIVDSLDECDEGRKICFDLVNRNCDAEVSTLSNSVKIDNKIMYYGDDFDNALLYGTIFSTPEIYECQLKRLMKRTSELSLLYLEKTEYLTAKGCSSNLESGLRTLADGSAAINSSFGIRNLETTADELGRRNAQLICRLF